MDTFFEQIVTVRKGGKEILAITGIWLAAFLVSAAVILFLIGYIGTVALLLAAGAIFGAYKLSTLFSVEYEYIVTNGTMDVDKITAKSSRKRAASFDLSRVERLEKYNPTAAPVGNFAKTVIACTPDSTDTYFMVVTSEGKGSTLIVFSPDERIKEAVVKSLPKFIANSAFKY